MEAADKAASNGFEICETFELLPVMGFAGNDTNHPTSAVVARRPRLPE